MKLHCLGRLDARTVKVDSERLIVTEAGKMTIADSEAEAQRCGAVLLHKGEQIIQIGKYLAGPNQPAHN